MTGPLAQVAQRSDHAGRVARAELVRAVRRATAEGMSRTEIAAEIGRSQPEVSRLLRFHGTSPLSRRLRRHRGDVPRLTAEAGGTDVRVVGSLATGTERDDSDIDLVCTMTRPLSLFELGDLEQAVSDVVAVDVDLLPDEVIRPALRERVLDEAVRS